MLFIQVSVTPNRVESGEITNSPKSLLHSVIISVKLFCKLKLKSDDHENLDTGQKKVNEVCLRRENYDLLLK